MKGAARYRASQGNQVFDLFCKLGAPDHILDFHTVYSSAKDGHASDDAEVQGSDMGAVLDAIIKFIPAPSGAVDDDLQLQVASIDHSSFLGRLGIGKISAGSVAPNMPVIVADTEGKSEACRITKVYRFIRDQMDLFIHESRYTLLVFNFFSYLFYTIKTSMRL